MVSGTMSRGFGSAGRALGRDQRPETAARSLARRFARLRAGNLGLCDSGLVNRPREQEGRCCIVQLFKKSLEVYEAF